MGSGRVKQPAFTLLLTTYETLVAEQTWLSNQIYFKYLFLDEAHRIRNEEAQVSHAARQVRSCYRVLLTGKTTLETSEVHLFRHSATEQPS